MKKTAVTSVLLKTASVFFACVVAATLATSCSKKSPKFSESERKTADSLVKSAGNTDSLKILCDRFIAENNALGSITALKELGKRYRNESNFDEALANHSKGLAIAEQVHDTLEIVQALNNIGTDYRRLGVLESATPYHYRAWKISEECSDTTYNAKKNMVVSLNGLGNVYLTTGNYDKAEEVFRLALAGEKKLKSSLGQAINYANLGSIFEHRGQLDSAWDYYRRSMELNKKAKSILGISLCHNYFGSLYEQEGDFEKAIEEYKASRKLMEASKDEWHSLNSIISLIHLYIKTDREDSAIKELPVAEEIADRINSNEHRAEICDLYYLVNKKVGNWAKALEYHEKASELQKSLVDMNKLNHIQSLSIAIEREQQERLTNEAEQKYLAEKTFRKSTFFVLCSVILLLLGLMAMLSYSMKVRRRSIDLLKHLSELRESLFVNITHELRTPLTIITGLNREIDKYAFNEEKVRELSGVVDRHGKSLLTLVNKLLDIAKIKSAPGEPDWRHGDMKIYVGMIADGYRDYAQERKTELIFEAPDSVNMDFVPDYINKIMNNLLSNAFKFTSKGDSIKVRVLRDENHAVLTVADTGTGIPKDKLKYIFEPFYQAESESKNIGSGVGLALVRQIVEAVDGEINVESKIGEGSKFTIRMPLKHGTGKWKNVESIDNLESIDEPMAQEEDGGMPADVDSGDENRIKLLIIDDNSDIAKYIGSQFEGKYDLFYAADGKVGLEKAREVLPDIIISDLMMPEMDGLTLCRMVRKDEFISHIPLILVTAKCSEEDRIKGFEAGVDAYIGKPFNNDELRVRVEKLLEQRSSLMKKFSKATQEGTETEVQRTDTDKKFLCNTVEIIHRLMDERTLDVAAVADELCMSQRQLNRKIMALTGETPAKYILQIRLRRAKQLIDSRADMSIEEISDICGFEHYSSFYHAFKKAYGVAPSDHKRGAK